MPETMQMPVSLYVPKLYEGDQALIHWKPMMGATGYTLECSVDEPFESACRGLSWDVLADEGMTWADLAGQWNSWGAFEQLPAKGYTWQNWERRAFTWQEFEAGNRSWKAISDLDVDFTVYQGPGFDTPAPDQGWRWTDYDHAGLTWGEMDAMTEYSWYALLFLPPRGLTWSQLDSEEHTWAQLASLGPGGDGYTWVQWTLLAVRGLTWDSLDARCLSWAQFEDQDRSWSEWEWLPPDSETHKGCLVDIPLGKQCARFRLRAHYGDDSSEPLTTARRPIVSKEDVEVSVKAGEGVSLLLDSDRVWSFDDAEFTVSFDESLLSLYYAMLSPFETRNPSRARPRVLSRIPGRLAFRCTQPIRAPDYQSGQISPLRFTARRPGKTKIRLERMNRLDNRIV